MTDKRDDAPDYVSKDSDVAASASQGGEGTVWGRTVTINKPREELYPEKKAVRDIDALLDKIGREGMDSLTAEERAALQAASAKLKEE